MGLPEPAPSMSPNGVSFDTRDVHDKKQKRVNFALVEITEETEHRPETIRVQTWPRAVADKSREIELDVEPNIHRPKGRVVEKGGIVSYVTGVFTYVRNFSLFPLHHY
ncbi:hypothetical protein VM1G_11576 [Cytospora mali]|uniref:Uncharacterized protein n=1 Tax=Cytospora mali TaxID=578113 RepID=A0A194VX43_CYTMA|nr:hypothetical protein VM1G_11576 [Valsa mali]